MRLFLLAVWLSSLCSLVVAQSTATPKVAVPAELRVRIEKQVRQYAEAPPDAQIVLGELTLSDVNGLYSLPVQIRGAEGTRTYAFLLSADFTRLIYQKTFDLTRDPFASALKQINTAERPFRGAENPTVQIVMYDDFQCPFCAKQYIALFNEVMNRYRDRVKVVLKDFPLTDAHPWAEDAATVAGCLARQSSDAYWRFSDYVHTHQQVVTTRWAASRQALEQLAVSQAGWIDAKALANCAASGEPKRAVEDSLAEGRSLGVSATPATFINGEFFEGVLTPEQLRAAIDRAIAEASPATANKKERPPAQTGGRK